MFTISSDKAHGLDGFLLSSVILIKLQGLLCYTFFLSFYHSFKVVISYIENLTLPCK